MRAVVCRIQDSKAKKSLAYFRSQPLQNALQSECAFGVLEGKAKHVFATTSASSSRTVRNALSALPKLAFEHSETISDFQPKISRSQIFSRRVRSASRALYMLR